MKAERTEHGASMMVYSVCRCCVVYFQRYGYMVTISQSAISRGDGREEDCEAVETVECVDDGVTGGWISELVYLWVVL